MLRKLLPLLIYVSVVASAPQDQTNTQVKYVRVQSVHTEHKVSNRQTRLENLSLPNQHIPGVESDSTERASETIQSALESQNDNEQSDLRFKRQDENTSDNDSGTETETVQPSTDKSETVQEGDANISNESNVDTQEVERTNNNIETSTKKNRFKNSRPNPPVSPRFYTKLNYFQKDNDDNILETNLIEKPGKRKFRTSCRCERIENCPKLQVSIPRCPEEYFYCCF